MKTEDLKALIKAEQKMDSGEFKYVMNHGMRMAVSDEIFDLLGLKQGQAINDQIALGIMKAEVDRLTALKAIDDAMD